MMSVMQMRFFEVDADEMMSTMKKSLEVDVKNVDDVCNVDEII